jgi:hypothetical protein
MSRLGRKLAVTAVAGTSVMMLVAPRAIADPSETLRPTGRGQTVSAAKAAGGKTSSNGISYHGGPVQTQKVTVVPIWYGRAWTTTKKTIVTGFLTNLGGSAYFNLNTTYYMTLANGTKVAVPNSPFNLDAGYVAPYLPGTTNAAGTSSTVSDAQIQQVVQAAVTSRGVLPTTTQDVQYLFMGDAGTNMSSGLGTQYCGWHTYANLSYNGGTYAIPYQADADLTNYLSSCSVQSTSPNGDPGIDAMLSVVAHEVEETATDVRLNAWYDSRGYENADKCAWTFGTTSTASNGSKYNVTLGGKQYLIQRNWVNASGGYCSMSY